MDAIDATEAAKFVECQKVIGVHYDTFGFIKIDHQWAKEVFAKAGASLTLLSPGEKLDI